jgi:RimJ/RimL family protein N-acetyltransferase
MDQFNDLSQVQSTLSTTKDISNNELTKDDPYPLPSNWSIFVCSPDNLKMVWDKLSQFPILWDDMIRGNYVRFCEEYIANDTIVLQTGDYGIAKICNIIPFRNADLHLAFWDRRFKGRDPECKQTLRWLFDKMKLERATIVLPSIVYYTINFVLSLGFRKEGTVRRAYSYNSRLLDHLIFGILKEDVFEKEEVTNG